MVQITDVFSPGVQKTFLWGMLNVNSLNEELAAVLTPEEIDLYKIGEWKMIGTEEALKVLTPVGSNFGVHEVSESDSLMVFELRVSFNLSLNLSFQRFPRSLLNLFHFLTPIFYMDIYSVICTSSIFTRVR